MTDIWDLIGFAGIGAGLSAYALMQAGRMAEQGVPYLTMNLTASLLLIISLMQHWNLGSFLLQVAWTVISLYGLAQTLRVRQRK
jgi:uncharacterized membrane protein